MYAELRIAKGLLSQWKKINLQIYNSQDLTSKFRNLLTWNGVCGVVAVRQVDLSGEVFDLSAGVRLAAGWKQKERDKE